MKFTVKTIDQLQPILKGFRKQRNLSQSEMAQKLGVSQQTYQVLEANPQNVSVERLYRVLVILEVDLALIDKHENDLKNQNEGIW